MTFNKTYAIRGAIVVGMAAVIAGGAFAYNAYATEKAIEAENAAIDAQVEQAYSDYEMQENAINVDATTLDRAGKYAAITQLEEFKASIDETTLTFHDGVVHDYSALVSKADESIAALKTSIIDEYKAIEAAATIDINAEDVSKESIQGEIDALNGLKDTMTTEGAAKAFESEDAYNAYVAPIDEKIAACNAKISEIVEAEEAAAAEAARAAAASSSSSKSSGSSSYSSGSSNSSSSKYSSGSSSSSSSSSGYSDPGREEYDRVQNMSDEEWAAVHKAWDVDTGLSE